MIMTKQERLAALKTTLDGFPGTIVPFGSTFQVLLTTKPDGDIVGEFDKDRGGYSTGTTKPIDGYAGSMTLYRGKREHAEELRDQFMEWAKDEISKLEKRLRKPKKVIEAAAADGAAMDAAESLLDREQMRREVVDSINKSPFQLTAALNHLFKALDASYAKDEEIAALRKDKEVLMQQYKNVLEAGNGKDLLIIKRGEQIQTLNEIISEREIEFRKMEASRDEYKALYQEVLAAAERQPISENKEEAK